MARAADDIAVRVAVGLRVAGGRMVHRSGNLCPPMARRARRDRRTSSTATAHEVLLLSALAVLVLLIYSNTSRSPFVFDDLPNITQNPHIRISELTADKLRDAAFESPLSRRPLANLSFALNHYFHEYDPFGYRGVNIVIHIVTGILLYFLAKTTLSIPAMRSRYVLPTWVPLAAASLWLVHPLQIQSVTYVVQRMNSLAALFYLLSLLFYAKARLEGQTGRKRAFFAGCVISGFLSLGFKEIAATLPFIILLYEWYFFQDLGQAWIRRHLLPASGLLICLAVLVFAYLGADPLDRILGTYESRDFTPTERVLTQFRVVIFYIGLLILPHPSRLALDYDFPLSHSLVEPITTLLSLATIVVLLGLAVFLRNRDRLSSFGILWFFGTLVIESSVIGLEIIFVHRTYLPSTFVCLMAVAFLARHSGRRWAGIAGLTSVGLLFSIWTYQWNGVWSDEVTLWTDGIEKAPGKSRPHINLGNAFLQDGRAFEALEQYKRALEIQPELAETHYNAGIVLHALGDYLQAIEFYEQAIELDPDHAKAHNNLGRSLAKLGRYAEAKVHYRRALALKPDHAPAHQNLGTVLADEGRTDEAITHYRAALRVQPNLKEAHAALGFALASQSKHDEAVLVFRDSLRVEPNYALAHYHLARSLTQLGRASEAEAHYAEALRLKPEWPEARSELEHLRESIADQHP